MLDPESYMGKAKATAIPRLTVDIAKSDAEIRADMRAIVQSW